MKAARDQKEIENVRNRILDSALAIIVKHGFNALTLRRLAGKIGMTAPNIYNYFSGKDEIYLTLVINGFELLHRKLAKILREVHDPLRRARELMRGYVSFGMECGGYYEIMFNRPTPKYNDYVGTPFEKLSAVELGLSMDIAEIARQSILQLLPEASEAEVEKRLIQIWSLLHGMVTLHHANIVSYVSSRGDALYWDIINETVAALTNSPVRDV